MGVSAFPEVILPPGMVTPFAGATAPDGWLLCNGAEVSKTTYAALWAAIGQTHVYGNPVDPTNNFLLPNLKGRTVVMQDSAQTEFSTLGALGGSKTSTASHTHDLSNHGHVHTAAGPNDNTSNVPSNNGSGYAQNHQGWQGPSNNTSSGQSDNHGHQGVTASHDVDNANSQGWPTGNAHRGFRSTDRSGVLMWGGYGVQGVCTLSNNSVYQDHTHTLSGHAHGLENHNHDLQSHTHAMKNHTHANTIGIPTNNTSGAASVGAASGNLQPFLALNYLIKT